MHVFTQFSEELHKCWNTAYQKLGFSRPFYLYSWHETWQKHLGGAFRLFLYTDESASIIVPIAIDTQGTATFTGGGEIADYLDAIGPESAKTDAWTTVISKLKRAGAKKIVLRNIPEDSKTLTFFYKQQDAVVTEEDVVPILTLPSSFMTYQESLNRKKRHELRRKMRRFEKDYPDTSFRVLTGPDVSVPKLLELMDNDPDKRTFLTPPMRSFFLSLPDVTGLTLVQFCIGKSPAPYANTLAIKHDTSILLYNSGYNPTIDGAGFYLKTRSIAWAIENGYKTYNFLQGGERYKYDLGGKDTRVYRSEMLLI